MADYKTPGVYVEEISTLPPSVGQVPTAIPAFIGYTQRASKQGKDLTNTPTHCTSLLEFMEVFGGACEFGKIHVNLDEAKSVSGVSFERRFYLFDAVKLFFANGGGECYIVSVGKYTDDVNVDAIAAGVDAVRKEDHPTMLLAPDAMLLKKGDQAYSIQQKMLMQCAELQDRVAVLDVYEGYLDRTNRPDDDVITNFRNGIGVNNLKYGAAYYPWIQSTLSNDFGFEDVILKNAGGDEITLEDIVSDASTIVNLRKAIADTKIINEFVSSPLGEGSLKEKFFNVPVDKTDKKDELVHYATILNDVISKIIKLKDNGISNAIIENELKVKTNPSSVLTNTLKSLLAIDLAAELGVVKANDYAMYDLSKVEKSTIFDGLSSEAEIARKGKGWLKSIFESVVEILLAIRKDSASIKENLDKAVFDTNPIYQSIVNEIQKQAAKVPPSGAISGIYAMVDNQRGVWKAPANVSLASTVRPWIKLDNRQQEDLNVDVSSGKSINAIRAFVGKGTLVWGARTLAGNDNEWRYISVRRFFNMVEKSVRLSTNWAVFEPNTPTTWIRVKAMIENYLTNLWQQGALAGSTPDSAFFVNVGLGSTMSQVDILEGRMNIEIGMAVVRPAEFIILKFSHKLQEA